MAVLVALEVRDEPKVSPFDELQHIDYLYKASGGHLVRIGEVDGQYAMRQEACRGIDGDFHLPPCGRARYAPAQFPEFGINTESQQPPPYYVLSGWFGRALHSLGVSASIVTGGRLAGVLWFGGAVVLLWLCFAEIGVGIAIRAAMMVLLVTAPAILYQAGTVNPDVTAPLAGAAVLYACLLWERRRVAVWVPGVIAAGCIVLKATNVIGVLAVALYLGFRWLQQVGAGRPLGDRTADQVAARTDEDGRARTSEPQATATLLGASTVVPSGTAVPAIAAEPCRSPRELVMAGASALIGAGVATVAITALQRATQLIPATKLPNNVRLHVSAFPWSQLTEAITFSPFVATHFPASLRVTSVYAVYGLVLVGVPGLAIAAAVTSASGSRVRAIGVSGVFATVLTIPLLGAVFYLTIRIWTPVSARYTFSAVPMVLLAAGAGAERPIMRRLVEVIAAIAAVVTLVALA